MKLSRILTGLAALNPFAVKVAAQGNSLYAYRNVLGIKVAVTGQAEQRAIIDYVTYGAGQKARVTKAMIGSPFAWVDPVQGQRLNILLTPSRPTPVATEAAPRTSVITPRKKAPKMSLQVAQRLAAGPHRVAPPIELFVQGSPTYPKGLTEAQKHWVAWNYGELDMTVDVTTTHLAGARWPVK